MSFLLDTNACIAYLNDNLHLSFFSAIYYINRSGFFRINTCARYALHS